MIAKTPDVAATAIVSFDAGHLRIKKISLQRGNMRTRLS
jgi:hypothetical protein